MSAAILLKQHDGAFLLTDAASYYDDGVVAMFRDKTVPIPALHCAVSTLGPLGWQNIIVTRIREAFTCFDEMKAGIEPLMRESFEANRDDVRWSEGKEGEAFFIGWSEQLQEPDAFSILLHDSEEIKKRNFRGNIHPPFEINSCDALMHCPGTTAELHHEARLPFSLTSMTRNGIEQLRPDVDLLHLLEIQRRMPNKQGWHGVGGYALLTSVDRHGVTQRRIHEWAEDKVGELIKPLPIDWVRWRAERDAPAASAKVLQMTAPMLNRHQRRQLKAAGRGQPVAQ